MNFLQVFEQLAAAELSQLNVADNGQIKLSEQPRIAAIIRAGVQEIYRRCVVKQGEVLLRTNENQDTYDITVENAVSQGGDNPYIIDSLLYPFKGDIMQINRITNSQGHSLWLNTDVPVVVPSENLYGVRPNVFDYQGVNFLSATTIKFNKGSLGDDLLIHYRAKPVFDMKDGDYENSSFYLPDELLNALVWYVASRIYNPMGSETIGRGMFHEGNNYASKYNEEIMRNNADLGSIGSMGESTNFVRNGWV